jgi:uncharacterized protein (TIGR00730 family)
MTARQGKAIKTVAVFCGSKFGNNPVYAEHAKQLGELLGRNGYDLVYGGGSSGLMGVVSQAARDAGSKVTGIITHAFRDAAWHKPLEGVEERVVRALSHRKARMLHMADAIIVLPGGIGTLDEQWEAAALLDMNIAGNMKAPVKPIIVLNTNGFYDDQKAQMKKAIREGFIHPGREELIRAAKTPQDVIDRLDGWNAAGLRLTRDIAQGLAKPSNP